jgi:hypothetical protein
MREEGSRGGIDAMSDAPMFVSDDHKVGMPERQAPVFDR